MRKTIPSLLTKLTGTIATICLMLPSMESKSAQIDHLVFPFITNYNSGHYDANTQNWSAAQDANNVMWFGNAAGILWYDGAEWGKVLIPNNSLVRSVAVLANNTILAGGSAEFGSVERDSLGQYYYQSWVERVPERYRDISDIWRIHEFSNQVYIQCYQRVLIFSGGQFVKSLEPRRMFRFSFVHKGRFYVEEEGVGLMVLEGSNLQLVDDGDFFSDKEVWFVGSISGNMLVGTQKQGLFIHQGGKWKPWNTDVNDFVKRNSLYSGIQTADEGLIFGTIRGGVVQASAGGSISRVINRERGLQNNTVLCMTIDRENNLWLGLDIGISYVKLYSPFYLLARDGVIGTGYCATVFDGRIYLGTNQGVFVYSERENDFVLISGSEGQVWSFYVWDDMLLCNHHNGLYIIRGTQMERVLNVQGCWRALAPPGHDDKLLIGTYNGLYVVQRGRGAFRTWRVRGLEESCRVMEFDSNNALWMSHAYKGIFKIHLNNELTAITNVQFFGKNQGLPSDFNNEVFRVNGEIIIATTRGLFNYNNITARMEPHSWNKLVNFEHPISKAIEDDWGRIYFFSNGVLSVAVIENDTLTYYDSKTFLPLRNRFLPSFENIYFLSNNRALFGTEYGFVLFDRGNLLTRGIRLPIHVSEFGISSDEFPNVPFLRIPFFSGRIRIPYRNNNIRIKFSTPYYLAPNNIVCSYQLNGEIINLEPSHRSIYLPGLREGSYSLIIDVKDITGVNHPNSIELNFDVLPPFYREWYAYLTYVFVGIILMVLGLLFVKNRVRSIKRRAKLVQQRKMLQHQILLKQQAQKAEQELELLRSEKLKNEMKHKNKELANAAYHIIQQNKLLKNLKDELSQLIKLATNEPVRLELKKISKRIEKDIKKENNWEVFDRYFDEVHQEFLDRLKKLHPQLTPNEMRLSAYLKMNISTKEIAPLMNISVRGIEISRYRLRKKLKIDRDVNLNDYLMRI